MPAELPVAGVSSIAFRIADGASIDAGSRFFMQYTSAPPSGAQQTSTAAAVSAAWSSNLSATTHSAEQLVEVVVTDLSSSTGARGVWNGASAGTESGTQLQAGMAALINHTISRRYRGGKPRTYLRTGVAGYLNGTNEWAATYIANITAAWQGFISDVKAISGANFSNIVNVSRLGPPWTYPLNPSGRPIPKGTLINPPRVDAITTSLLATKLGSQRRRLNI